MYRQINKERNCRAIVVDEFPAHIQKLLKDMRRKEEEDRINKEKENDMIKVNIFCLHPSTSTMQETKIPLFMDSTLAEAAQDAYQRFKLESIVDPDDCRIVFYNKKQECIECSFDADDLKICDILQNFNEITINCMFLEIREPGKMS